MSNPTRSNSQAVRRANSIAPQSGTSLFTPKLTDIAKEVVPGCVHRFPAWLSRKLADTVGNKLVEETYDATEEQYKAGPRGQPMRDKDNRIAFYADQGVSYSYKGRTKETTPWTSTLAELKTMIQDELGVPFNAATVRYHILGSTSLEPHSDTSYIPQIGEQPVMAILGFGVTRTFEFRPVTQPDNVAFTTEVANGDLLLMHGRSQVDWVYALPPSDVRSAFIAVTFRFHLPNSAVSVAPISRKVSNVFKRPSVIPSIKSTRPKP